MAGTAIKVHVQSFTPVNSWTNVDVSIDSDRMRLDIKGPTAHGSLIYDRDSSQLTVVDHLRKVFFQFSSTEQLALKLLAGTTAAHIQGQLSTAQGNGAKDWETARRDIIALFNGQPTLKAKGVALGSFTCDEWVSGSHAKYGREVWVTSPMAAGMSDEDYHTYRSLLHLGLDLFGDALTQFGADTAAVQQDLLGEDLPVAAVLYVQGKMVCKYRVMSIRPQTFTAGAFDPPVHYQLKSLMDVVIK